MNNEQEKQLKQVTDLISVSVQDAFKALNVLVEQLTEAKTLANHMRWRLLSKTDGISAPEQAKPTVQEKEFNKRVKTVIDPVTGIEGIVFENIDDIFYNVAGAAKYLQVDKQKIKDEVCAGMIYAVTVHQVELLPLKALDVYKRHAGGG